MSTASISFRPSKRQFTKRPGRTSTPSPLLGDVETAIANGGIYEVRLGQDAADEIERELKRAARQITAEFATGLGRAAVKVEQFDAGNGKIDLIWSARGPQAPVLVNADGTPRAKRGRKPKIDAMA